MCIMVFMCFIKKYDSHCYFVSLKSYTVHTHSMFLHNASSCFSKYAWDADINVLNFVKSMMQFVAVLSCWIWYLQNANLLFNIISWIETVVS